MGFSFINASYHLTLGTTQTGTEPTNVQNGDLIVAIVSSGGTQTGPAGWTQVNTEGNASSYFSSVWYIQRGITAPSYSWTVGAGGSDIDICAWRGAGGVANITGKSANGSAVAPSVTTTLDNCLLICSYTDANDTSVTVPSGMTRRSLTGNSSFNNVAELQLGAAGATGTKTFTTTTSPVAAWSLALYPAFAPPVFQHFPNRIWRGRRR